MFLLYALPYFFLQYKLNFYLASFDVIAQRNFVFYAGAGVIFLLSPPAHSDFNPASKALSFYHISFDKYKQLFIEYVKIYKIVIL